MIWQFVKAWCFHICSETDFFVLDCFDIITPFACTHSSFHIFLTAAAEMYSFSCCWDSYFQLLLREMYSFSCCWRCILSAAAEIHSFSCCWERCILSDAAEMYSYSCCWDVFLQLLLRCILTAAAEMYSFCRSFIFFLNNSSLLTHDVFDMLIFY